MNNNVNNNLSDELLYPGEMIALIDDFPDIVELLSDFLKQYGFNVKIYSDYNDFIGSLNQKFALVFLELNDTGIDSLKAVYEINKISPNTSIVMLTAITDLQIALGCIRYGASDYLAKPVHFTDLIDTIHRVLSKRRNIMEENKYKNEMEELIKSLSINDKKEYISRHIEFPQEYIHAGIGILNYFGTILREKYPDKTIKVKIEQQGLSVRMIIESDKGDKDEFERILKKYEEVIKGESPPTELLSNQLQIIDLKNELRIALMRIQHKSELLEYKQKEVDFLKTIIGDALTKSRNRQYISISPSISVGNVHSNLSINNNTLTEFSDEIELLIKSCKNDEFLKEKFNNIKNLINNINCDKNKDKEKNLTSLEKVKKFIEEAQQSGTKLNIFLNSISGGIEKMQSIGAKYNSVAEWCGAPQIPQILLK